MLKTKAYLYATATVLVTVAGPGAAQSTTPAQQAGVGTLEEIVVTAGKRTENIQDVPLAVTVVSAGALEQASIREFTDLTRVSPSLTISKTTQPANNSIIMRGIGTFAFSIGVEPSVSVVVDDVPVAFQAQAFTDLLDVERIEVLRGPQSTLYGKNASAGLISVVTQAPSDEWTARAEVMATDDEERRLAATVSGPIGDTAGVRLTASTSEYDGNVRNLTTGEMLNGRDDRSVRGKLLWQPTESLDVGLTAYYNDVETNCCVGALISLTPGLRFYNLPGAAFSQAVALEGITVNDDNINVRNDTAPRGDSTDYGGSARISYRFGDHELSSITGYQRYEMFDDQDVDGSATNLFGAVAAPLSGGPRAYGEFDVRSLSQEFRLTSPDDRAFRYVLGLFHGANDLERYFFRGPQVVTGEYFTTVESKSYALFGQSTWDIVPKLSLITGVRFNREDIAYTYENLLARAYFADSHDDSAVTGRAGLQYRPSDDWMLFATWSTGYKGQAYDLTSSFNAAIAAVQPVEAETSVNREVGFKSTLFSGRMIVNVTAFDTEFEDFQAQSREPSIGGAFVLSNVGRVRTRGVELDTAASLGKLTLSGGAAYVDATIEEFAVAQCYPQQTAALGCVGGAQNLTGARLNNAPEWKVNLGGDYRFGLGSLPFEAFIGGTYTYQSEVNFTLTQDPDAQQEGYGLLNLSTGLADRNERYKLTVFVNNVFDKHYAMHRQDNSNYWVRQQVGNAVVRTPARDSSRYVGVRLGVSF
jgi:iron complex outermembrane recepter protein